MPKKSAAAIAEKAQAARAGAAERMRCSRKRRLGGLRCYILELRDGEIEALVQRGLLSPGEQANRNAVMQAMSAFLDRTLGRPRDAQHPPAVTRNGGRYLA
jgi:hypothetical protein